jgi:hypothetical protein
MLPPSVPIGRGTRSTRVEGHPEERLVPSRKSCLSVCDSTPLEEAPSENDRRSLCLLLPMFRHKLAPSMPTLFVSGFLPSVAPFRLGHGRWSLLTVFPSGFPHHTRARPARARPPRSIAALPEIFEPDSGDSFHIIFPPGSSSEQFEAQLILVIQHCIPQDHCSRIPFSRSHTDEPSDK